MLKFALDERETVAFSGSIATEAGGGGVSARILLSDDNGAVVGATSPPSQQPFSYVLDLDAGEYTLMAKALALTAGGPPGGSGGFSGRSDFSFTFQVIPEPTVVSPIGLALASAMVTRRRWSRGTFALITGCRKRGLQRDLE